MAENLKLTCFLVDNVQFVTLKGGGTIFAELNLTL